MFANLKKNNCLYLQMLQIIALKWKYHPVSSLRHRSYCIYCTILCICTQVDGPMLRYNKTSIYLIKVTSSVPVVETQTQYDPILKYYFGDSRSYARSITTQGHEKVNIKGKNVKIGFLTNTNRRSVVSRFD